MSSRAKKIGKQVKEKQNETYMNNMYDLFNLSLFQLLSLRQRYLSLMKKREKEKKRILKAQKRVARKIIRSYKHGKKN
jgi:hypothetical protein